MLRHPVLRKVGKFLLLFLGALMLASVLTATFFENKIGRSILSALNRQLVTELEVKDFELSFFREFPRLSASLRGVSLLDTNGNLLLQADRMSFSLGLFSFVSSEYDLRKVSVSDGVLHLRWDETGAPNYAVLDQHVADSLADPSAGNISFSLSEATLERVEFDLIHMPSHRQAKGRMDLARFSGQFGPRRFTLKNQAKGRIGFIEAAEQRFFINQPFSYTAEWEVDWEEGMYDIADLAMVWGNSRLSARGKVTRQDAGLRYAVTLTGDRIDPEDVVALLPRGIQREWHDYRTSGRMTLQGSLSGLARTGKLPLTRIRLTLDRGRLSGPVLGEEIRDLAFTARFQTGGGAPDRLRIDSLRAYFGRQLVEGRLTLAGTTHPELGFELNGNLPVSGIFPLVAGLLDHPHLERGLGRIELRNLKGESRLRLDSSGLRVLELGMDGEVGLDDAGLRIRGEDIRFDKGVIQFHEGRIRLEDLKLEGAASAVVLNGEFFRPLPLWTGKERAEEASFSLRMEADRFDLDRLLRLAPLAPVAGDGQERLDSLARERMRRAIQLSRNVRGMLDARIRSFAYQDLRVENFEGTFRLDQDRLTIDGNLETMGGRIATRGNLLIQEEPQLEATLNARGIRLEEAFRQTRNFGQDLVKSENLKGKLHTRMVLQAFWDEKGQFAFDKLRVQAGVGIADGELNRLEVLEQFADYVNINDLRRIRFADMQHYLEVRRSTVYLPVLFLQSNALNMSLSGLHRFDGNYRYNVKINAGQVLTNRFRRHDPSLRPKPARRKGFFNLYYRLQGNDVGLKVEKARREVRDDFDRSRQRTRFVQASLKEAFGESPPIGEPEEWKDESSAGGGEDFLDFDLSGGTY